MQELSRHNEISLFWVPGHSDFEGNEYADELARDGSSFDTIGTMPYIPLPLSRGWTRNNIKNWISIRYIKYWRSLETCKQTKQIRSLEKCDPRKLVGALTEHYYFSTGLNNMGFAQNTKWNRCEQDEDTAYDLLCLCPSLANRRLKIFGDFVLSLKLKISDIIKFIQTITFDA